MDGADIVTRVDRQCEGELLVLERRDERVCPFCKGELTREGDCAERCIDKRVDRFEYNEPVYSE